MELLLLRRKSPLGTQHTGCRPTLCLPCTRRRLPTPRPARWSCQVGRRCRGPGCLPVRRSQAGSACTRPWRRTQRQSRAGRCSPPLPAAVTACLLGRPCRAARPQGPTRPPRTDGRGGRRQGCHSRGHSWRVTWAAQPACSSRASLCPEPSARCPLNHTPRQTLSALLRRRLPACCSCQTSAHSCRPELGWFQTPSPAHHLHHRRLAGLLSPRPQT